MSNPFNEARQQQLKDDATELLKKFSVFYLKNFGMAMFIKAKEELEKEEADPRKLKYRDWGSVERDELYHAWVYMKSGSGPGDFSKWKKVYIAERQDYSIAVYPSDKDFEKKKLPKLMIKPAGYKLERDVSWYFRWLMKTVADGVGLSDAELEVMTGFSSFSWALVHPWRKNYLFQLHKGKDPACGCMGGGVVEPEGAGAEFAEEREAYLEVFDRCVANNCVRDKDSAKGLAFEMTRDQLSSKMDRLAWWHDDGTESQMLCDALLMQCLVPLRDEMLADLSGPVSIKLMTWYKIRSAVYTVLEKLVDPAWVGVQTGADKIAETVDPVLKKGLGPIMEARDGAKAKVKSAVVDKVSDKVAKGVTPFLDPIFKAFDNPLTKGFASCRTIIENIPVSSLPADNAQMRARLDAIPRTASVVIEAHKASIDLVAPLRLLKKLSEEVFDSLDVWQVRADAEMLLLSTLDAAMFTLGDKIEEGDRSESVKGGVLKGFDHDAVVGRATFMKDIMKSILISNFMKIVNPVTEPVIESMNDVIPEPMQNILDIAAIIDEVVDMFVGEPICKMVDRAYPVPK